MLGALRDRLILLLVALLSGPGGAASPDPWGIGLALGAGAVLGAGAILLLATVQTLRAIDAARAADFARLEAETAALRTRTAEQDALIGTLRTAETTRALRGQALERIVLARLGPAALATARRDVAAAMLPPPAALAAWVRTLAESGLADARAWRDGLVVDLPPDLVASLDRYDQPLADLRTLYQRAAAWDVPTFVALLNATGAALGSAGLAGSFAELRKAWQL